MPAGTSVISSISQYPRSVSVARTLSVFPMVHARSSFRSAGATTPAASSSICSNRARLSTHPVISWAEGAAARSARWRSHSEAPPPNRVMATDDRLTADEAYGLACQGTALLWRGDFQIARQMLVALGNRADRQSRKPRRAAAAPATAAAAGFHRYRQARAQRARTLAMLLVLLDGDYRIALPRAPDIREACLEAY